MNISFLIYSLEAGGAERVISILANNLIKRGFKISIICFSEKPPFYLLDKKIKKISIVPKKKSFLKNIKHLRKIIIAEKIEVIISFTTTMNLYNLFVNLNLKRKTIICERTDPNSHYLSQIKIFLRKIFYNKSNYLIVQNEIQSKYFKNFVSREKIIKIYNPIVINKISPNKKKKCNIITVGRLDTYKNTKALIKCFIEAKLNCLLFIIGDGPKRKELESYVLRNCLNDKIIFLGLQKNVSTFLKAKDIFASTSLYEGFPNALLEAMSAGLSCIHYNCPSGIDEIIEDGKNGYLVPLNDTIEFSKKLFYLYNNLELREEFSKNARKKVEQFEVNKIVDQWITVIKE